MDVYTHVHVYDYAHVHYVVMYVYTEPALGYADKTMLAPSIVLVYIEYLQMFDWNQDNVIVTGSSDGIVRVCHS